MTKYAPSRSQTPILAPEFEAKLAVLYWEELAAIGLTRKSKDVPKKVLQDAMMKASKKLLEGTYR